MKIWFSRFIDNFFVCNFLFKCPIFIISSLNSHVVCTNGQYLRVTKSIMEKCRLNCRIKIRLFHDFTPLRNRASGVGTVCHTRATLLTRCFALPRGKRYCYAKTPPRVHVYGLRFRRRKVKQWHEDRLNEQQQGGNASFFRINSNPCRSGKTIRTEHVAVQRHNCSLLGRESLQDVRTN
jgi:hypothetical protein